MAKANGEVAKVLSVIHMRGITLRIKRMGMAYFTGRVVIYTKESIGRMSEMGLAR